MSGLRAVISNAAPLQHVKLGSCRANALHRPFSRGSRRETREKGEEVDAAALLAEPTWSVASLLPPSGQTSQAPEISSKQLHHLLRLSALAPPKDAEEESKMLETLASQLHFVRDIQQVDTTGVEPLQSLRDETASGENASELGMAALSVALGKEDVRGKFHKRIRRRRDVEQTDEAAWDPLSTASKKVGRFFVVEGGKNE
ncbi:hypothetical protein B0A50_02348 [Salinomyces thailandicus]|uniref:Glutamyl-tRNA amidotransferase complex subunit Gta3 domain-containing protein n=1 Tax=Salinomyces thailandicus TaxID=706561 RepID=A0A4U0U6E9_9PEZI|nr:hypothetical protein B0A50_02348 [Salinomyces thailandica]